MNKRSKRFYGLANYRHLLECGPGGLLSGFLPCPAHLKLRAFVQFAWRRLIRSHSPRFAKYQPALRLGTRKVEQRLLSRLAGTRAETAF